MVTHLKLLAVVAVEETRNYKKEVRVERDVEACSTYGGT
jgi:hypothetical protein